VFRALGIAGRAVQLWWQHLGQLALFNAAWLALQVPIITGPPATAAMYVLARRVVDGELLDLRDGWQALRQMWWPAWRWGLVNGVVLAALIGNFWAYQAFTGWGWTALRLAWGVAGVLWLTVNLFYWPFWLAQADRRMTVTLRNGLVTVAKAPVLSLTLLALCALLVTISVLVTLPLAAALMAWLALIGTLAVDHALHALPRQPAEGAPESEAEAEPI
jgi:uncharacterized membrane protein YesL